MPSIVRPRMPSATSATRLWSIRDMWSNVSHAVEQIKSSSVVKQALNESAGAAQQLVNKSCEEAEQLKNSPVVKQALNESAGAAQQFVKKAAGEAEQLKNSSIVKEASNDAAWAAEQLKKKVAEEAEQLKYSSAVVEALNDSAWAAQQLANKSAEGAEQLMNSSAVKQLVNSSAFVAPPQCLNAMEIAAAIAAGVAVAPVLLEAVGFSGEGVAAESLASAWQGSLGNVAKGSAFALLQSAGATGYVWKNSLTLTGASAFLASAFCGALFGEARARDDRSRPAGG
ncbi:unnamed protein product [Prorocentrum cordatum]|uniref:Uncharacterized protein n=1 Tax=Prorocentrum cordatum TaxID=2364126 RepID=A0ABN9S1U3_9DINO|nr:unnamed protein product [Polarella glacialis]